MNADDIKKIVDARDKTINEAQVEFNKTVSGLQAEFADAQKKLAESFQEREKAAYVKADKTANDAFVTYDKALDELAKATMVASIPANDKKVRVTAEQVIVKYKAADLKLIAKERGLSINGSEIVVAQRLLDAGWVPDPSVMK
jgi:hypothetical protein